MSIRVQCEKCSSVLKIKEELAGTKGKCPKCKNAFRVPTLEEARAEAAALAEAKSAAASESAEPTPATTQESQPVAPETVAAPPKTQKASAAKQDVIASAEEKPAKKAAEQTKPPKPAAEKSAAAVAEVNGDGGPDSSHELGTYTEPKTTPPANKESKVQKAASADDEFDPAAFLMEGPKPKPIPPPSPTDMPAGRRGASPARPMGERLEMSDDDDTQAPGRQETTTPPPRSGGRSAADIAGAMLSGGAATASSAKDLLARSMQESRTRANQMPQEDKGPKTDYVAILKEVFRTFGLQIVGTVVACVVLYSMVNYMLTDPIPLPELAPVSGKVTLKGQPLAGVTVYFMVIGDKTGEFYKDGREARNPSAVTESDGSYELMYLPEEGIEGAVIGQNRVWIEPIKIEDYKNIPGQFQSAATSGIIKEVKPGGAPIDIQL